MTEKPAMPPTRTVEQERHIATAQTWVEEALEAIKCGRTVRAHTCLCEAVDQLEASGVFAEAERAGYAE